MDHQPEISLDAGLWLKGEQGKGGLIFKYALIYNAELALHNNPYGNSSRAENSSPHNVLPSIFDNWNKYSKL
jgi:hypothetical protein